MEGEPEMASATRVQTYLIDLCDYCAAGVESGQYVAGCAFCDVGLHPHEGLYKFGWLRPQPSPAENQTPAREDAE
jgi:hypothetical protein